MTAMPNDELSMLEIERLIADTRKRMDVFDIGRQTILDPKDYRERALIDLIFMNVYQTLEEANSLSFEAKTAYGDIPWDQVRGMRNRFAHDYSHIDRSIVWETLESGFPDLERMAKDYIERHGLSDPGKTE